MANVALAGFQPYTKEALTVALERKRVLTNNTTAIFKGDAVDAVNDGGVIVTASATTDLYSVQWGGASYVSGGSRLERNYLPAATLYTSTGVDPFNASFIYCVQNMVSQMFVASAGTAVTMTNLGNNTAMTLGTGSTTTGLSGHKLDTAAPATTATLPWRLIDFMRGDPTNDPDAADAKMVILVNAGDREPALEPGGSLGT